jgi:putative transposase
MAKQRRYTALEIAAKLKEASGLAREGKPQSDIAKSLGISVMTFHRWRKAHENPPQGEENRLPAVSNYTSSSLSATRQPNRLSELQLENARLRTLVTDLLLEKMRLEDAVREKFRRPRAPRQLHRKAR